MRQVQVFAFFLGVVALVAFIFALQLLSPGDTLHYEGPGGARIVFSAEHAMVVAPGGCVKVNWQVDQIQAVYLDEAPVTGQGVSTICLNDDTAPDLRVQFTDGSEAHFTLPIAYLVQQVSTLLLLGMVVLVGLACLLLALTRPVRVAQSEGRAVSRTRSVFAVLGMVFTGLLVTAVLLELGLRFYFGRFGTRMEQQAYLMTRAEIEASGSNMIVLPFVEYGLSPDFPGHTTLGYRGDEVEVPKPDGVYRIVALGDSATYGTTNPYNQTYPYYLQQVLRDQYGYTDLEVVNAGVFGFTSWNTLVDLSLRVLELQPDLVIIYQGGNDVMPREVAPECYAGASPFLGLDPRRQVRGQPAELSPFALYRFLTANSASPQASDSVEANVIKSRLACDVPAGDDLMRNVEANPPTYFERNIRSMVGVAQAHGFDILFATYAYNPHSPYAYPYWRAGVEEDNVVTARVAQELGTYFIDYAAIAPTDAEYWNDSIHMTSAGNQFQAETFAQFLVDQGVLSAAAAAPSR